MTGNDVDDLQVQCPQTLVETPMPAGGVQRWLGLVVPKRHARRAVTRTLVKRQIRHIAAACAPQLEPGLWVVRQRHPFDVKQFPSAASDALKEAARAELRALFERAVRGERDRVKPRPAGATDPGTRPGKGSKAYCRGLRRSRRDTTGCSAGCASRTVPCRRRRRACPAPGSRTRSRSA